MLFFLVYYLFFVVINIDGGDILLPCNLLFFQNR